MTSSQSDEVQLLAIRPRPLVYLLAPSLSRNAVEDLDELCEDLEQEGFQARIVSAPDGPTSLAELVEAIPLLEMAANRARIAAFIHWFQDWEGRLGDERLSDANSGIRTVLTQRFRGIPFLVLDLDSQHLASKWRIDRTRDLRRRAGGHPGYFASRFSFAIRELNLGLLNAPFRNQWLRQPAGSAKHRPYRDVLQVARRLGIRRDTLERAIAQSFPGGLPVEVVKCMQGLSGALVFAAKSGRSAPKLIKMTTWDAAVSEYEGARFVVSPRLRSFAASVITPGNGTGPSLIEQQPDGQNNASVLRFGLLVYPIVATPGNSLVINSLGDLIQPERLQGEAVPQLVEKLDRTLEQVLGQLHCDGRKPARDTLWGWLGRYLPPLLAIRLVAGDAGHPDGPSRDPLVVPSYRDQGYKADAAALLAEACWREIFATLPREKGQGGWPRVKVCGAIVDEIGPEQLIVRVPDLGFRIVCEHQDLQQTLDGLGFLKVGHPVDVEGELSIHDHGDWRGLWMGPPPQEDGDSEAASDENQALARERLRRYLGAAELIPATVTGLESLPFSVTFEARRAAIHGDLNLNNIQFSGDNGLGWLIDFDRADEAGMLAIDFAKLEIELLSHHVIPELDRLCRCFPLLFGGRKRKDGGDTRSAEPESLRDLNAVLRTLDTFGTKHGQVLGVWQTIAAEEGIYTEQFGPGVLSYLESLLQVTAVIRARANSLMHRGEDEGEPAAELALGLWGYALVAGKFAARQGDQVKTAYLRRICWHYRDFAVIGVAFSEAPQASGIVAGGEDLNEACHRKSSEDIRRIDGALYRMAVDADFRLATGVKQLYGRGEPLSWACGGQGLEVWDFASTGSVANISPLVGYLWLMTRTGSETAPVLVPKISSTGASCGTVDVLEAGGYRFPDNRDQIVRKVCRDKGALCRQSEEMVRVDRYTMQRRKRRNLMKNPRLVLSSILAKKKRMGCTHAVIDLKLGMDTKFLSRTDASANRRLCLATEGDYERVPDCPGQQLEPSQIPALGKYLKEEVGMIASSEAAGWLQYEGADLWGSGLSELRILCSNADMPQGRAIGRLLILLQMDRELNGDASPFSTWPREYQDFYLRRIPAACGVTEDRDSNDDWAVQAVKDAWTALREALPVFADPTHEHYGLLRIMDAVTANPVQAGSRGVEIPLEESLGETLGYLQVPTGKTGRLKSVPAYALDALFDRLCENDTFDPAVGFWLHYLPQETIQESDAGKPFLTVFFRPAVISEVALKLELDTFMTSVRRCIEPVPGSGGS